MSKLRNYFVILFLIFVLPGPVTAQNIGDRIAVAASANPSPSGGLYGDRRDTGGLYGDRRGTGGLYGGRRDDRDGTVGTRILRRASDVGLSLEDEAREILEQRQRTRYLEQQRYQSQGFNPMGDPGVIRTQRMQLSLGNETSLIRPTSAPEQPFFRDRTLRDRTVRAIRRTRLSNVVSRYGGRRSSR